MYDFVSNISTGTFRISDKFDVYGTNSTAPDAPPLFSSIGDEYILAFTNLENVKKIIRIVYDTLGLNDTRYLIPYYRISRDLSNWSEWILIQTVSNGILQSFPTIDPNDPFHMELKWVRQGTSNVGAIKLIEYRIDGELERPTSVAGSTVNVANGQMQIIQNPYVFKVFSISDLEIISASHPNGLPTGVSIKYRYSQDSTRTWSNWEPLTKANIISVRINPIRFFQIEYMIENNSGQSISIQDINLVGDFQNVSKDSQKTNLYGIRECCESNLYGTYDANGNFIPNTNLNSSGGGPTCDPNTFAPMTADEKANLYNPYAQNTAMKLLEKLSNDSQQMFGHKVIYFATDPDKKGQDHILNEYQLYNVVCQGEVKISVEGNNFPDSQIVMNQFDLNLFESMEVHITKQQFKEVFGVQRRPAKEDFLYFCNLNRMYVVDHAQQFRSFNNSAVYYKLILKKYHKSANVRVTNPEVKNQLDKLTKNTTIEELMGVEQAQDKAAVANKPQLQPLTRDNVRLEILAEIDKELIENSSTIISKANYDLSSVTFSSPAVIYRNLDPYFKESNNLSLQIWFNIHNYIPDEVYSFFDSYDSTENKGWKTSLSNDKITVTLNDSTYDFNLNNIFDASALLEETWYCYVMNLDQRQRVLSQYIYKRNVEEEDDAADLTNTILRRVYSNSQTMTPVEYYSFATPMILGSDMKVTNIRLFSDILPENMHTKMLNQYIIGEDSKYLIFADNATTRLYLPRFPLFE
jgi:hypothetical protein